MCQHLLVIMTQVVPKAVFAPISTSSLILASEHLDHTLLATGEIGLAWGRQRLYVMLLSVARHLYQCIQGRRASIIIRVLIVHRLLPKLGIR